MPEHRFAQTDDACDDLPILTRPAAPDVSVVICTYTEARWNDLNLAIESVRAQTIAPRETIVGVDHNPRLFERVRAEIPDVVVVENHGSPGLSGTRNSGIALASGAVVAFLDDDAVAAPEWLEHLSAAYADPDVQGVGGTIEAEWPDQRPAWFPEEFNWVVGCTYPGLPSRPARVRNLIGANMSFRRDVVEAIGGFRAGVGQVDGSPLRGDDTEFCIRVNRHQGQPACLHEPRVRVRHRQSPARARWGYFCSICYAQGHTKALIAHLHGHQDGLASEWGYVSHTLPAGILRGLGDALRRGDPGGLARAGAIIAGLALTTTGFLIGSLRLPVAEPADETGPAEAVSLDAAR